MHIFTRIIKIFKKDYPYINKNFIHVVWGALVLNILLGSLFYLIESPAQENLSYLDSLWWAMVTMTTVGYGDLYPVTTIGRFLLGYPTMILGIGIIGYLIGLVSDFIINLSQKTRKGLVSMSLSNHLVICNYPSEKKIIKLISELKENPDYHNKKFVLLTDKIEEIPKNLVKLGIKFVSGSPTDEENLLRAGVDRSFGVIILSEDDNCASTDERNYTILSLINFMKKEKELDLRVVVEVVNENNLKLMSKSGSEGLVTSSGLSGSIIAQEFSYPGLHDIFRQIISNNEHTPGSQFYLHETSLAGFKIFEVQVAVLEHPANIQVIGLIKNKIKYLNPPKDMIIEEGDQLIILSENKKNIKQIESDIINSKKFKQ